MGFDVPRISPLECEHPDPGRFAMLTNEQSPQPLIRGGHFVHLRRDEVGAQRAGWLPALRGNTILEDTNCLMHPIRWKERR